MALATAERLANFLGVGTADSVSELSQFSQYTNYADAYIKRYCRNPYLDVVSPGTALTEYYDGPGSRFLVLDYFPVLSVQSVYLDRSGAWGQGPGAFASQTQLVQGQDFALKLDGADGTSRSALLVRLDGAWPQAMVRTFGLLSVGLDQAGPGVIKVSYTVGWAGGIPADLEMACVMLAARMRQAAPWGTSLDSVGQEGVSLSFAGAGKNGLLTKEIRQMIDPYRRLRMGA